MPANAPACPVTDDEAARELNAVATLCDHAEKVWSFFAGVLGTRPLCRDELARASVQADLDCGLWPSKTAREFCARSVVSGSEERGEQGDLGDLAKRAAYFWSEFQEERKTLLEGVEPLYPPAINECHEHGGLAAPAHEAAKNLTNQLRGLWSVAEWDDWSEHHAAVANAISEARVWASPARHHADIGESVAKALEPILKGVAETNRQSGDERKPPGAWLGTALILRKNHPDWSNAKIAREVGVDPSTLSRNDTYQNASAMSAGRKDDIPAGVQNKQTGEFFGTAREAANRDDRGEPIPGSRYVKEYCRECDQPMRVTPDRAGQNPRCDDCGG